MKLIAHRRNTRRALRDTPPEFGVEIDLRSRAGEVILQHDPFTAGEPLQAWLEDFHHGTLILNIKEEGLESTVLEALSRRGIADFFFLDQSFPFLMKTAARGERRSAVRVSEVECIDTALALAGRVDWVWVDCFSRFPLDRPGWTRLVDAGFRLCLVSPELVGRDAGPEVAAMRRLFDDWGVEPDAVCAKLEAAHHWIGPPAG